MFFEAQLGWQIKWLTAVTFLILAGVSGILLENFPSIAVMAIDGVILFTALLWGFGSKIKGYELQPGKLVVARLFGRKEILLEASASAEIDLTALKGSVRTFGNGGFWAVSGFYYNKRLGNFRAYVSDLQTTIVVRTPEKTVVISPNSPEAFLEYFNRRERPNG